MRVDFFFRGEYRASARTLEGGAISYLGPGASEVEAIAEHYAPDGSLGGQQLLELLLDRLRGHWQAVVRSD